MGILDETVALAFDMECSEVLTEWEMESEAHRIESAVAGIFTESTTKPDPKQSGPIVLNAQVHS